MSVAVDNNCSNPQPVNFGVPQGSVLVPIFLMNLTLAFIYMYMLMIHKYIYPSILNKTHLLKKLKCVSLKLNSG